MDEEIQRLLNEAESTAKGILTRNRRVLDNLAEALMKEEVLDKADVEQIIKNSDKSEIQGNAGK
jgi:ATP-dependent Zn protease